MERLHNEKIVKTLGGDIFRIIRSTSSGFNGFEELYISKINKHHFKGWKRHNQATLNLFVIYGDVEFTISDRLLDDEARQYRILGDSGIRLEIPPGLWVGFYGHEDSAIINCCNLIHDPDEFDVSVPAHVS